jgi:photosystem II stability/assembly factor-like uncharacterized protein
MGVLGSHVWASGDEVLNPEAIYPIFHSTDNGSTWVIEDYGVPTFLKSDCIVPTDSLIYIGTSGDGVFNSSNNGQLWIPVDSGLPPEAVISTIEVSESSSLLVLAKSGVDYNYPGGVFRLSKGAIIWQAVDTIHQGIQAFAAIGSILFSSGDKFIYKSNDDGVTWSEIGLVGDTGIGVIALLANGSDLYAVAGYDGVLRSTDSGKSWTELTNGFAGTYWNTLIASRGILFAGTIGGGVFESTDNGATWITTYPGIPYLGILSLAANDKYLFAGTSEGILRRPLSDFAGVNSTRAFSASLTIFPNPFVGRATLTHSSQSSGTTQVSIHNILGAEVTQLYSGELSSGEHSFTWDAKGMPAGMYVCMVRRESGVMELPMLLVK